ncbi:MAG TPA: hypothetical protein VHV55_17185 [Pirellulales bacterium]|nr:hypothetical protein [Pirellulales bacterium]
MGLAAAACLVVVVVYSVAWHGREKNQVADLKPVHDNSQGKTSHAGNSGYFVWGRTVADFPDSLGPPGFAWPLAGTSPPASSCASRAISFD